MMKRSYRSLLTLSTFFFLSILATPSVLYSQKPPWINYTNIDYITSLASYNNIIWIGARGGVVRFDPANMSTVIFTRADGLVTNDVQSVAVGPDGRVWASGTWGNNGIGVYDGSSWTTVVGNNPQQANYTDEFIYQLHVAGDGTVWFTMNGGQPSIAGLWNYKNGAMNMAISGSVYVQSFAVDVSNHVWAAVNPGVDYYDGTQWTQLDSLNSGLGSNTVNKIIADRFGRVWFSTTNGIFMYNGTSWHHYTLPISVTSASDLKMSTVDSKGNLWVTYSPWSVTPKILEFDGSQWQVFDSTRTGLSQYSRITSSCADSLGSVYFALVPVFMTRTDLAYRGGGQLLGFDGTKWQTVDVHSGTLPFSPVYHFGLAGDGSVWMGTDLNGVIKDNGNSWQVFDSLSSGIFASNWVNGIAFDAYGGVWVVGSSVSVMGSTMGKSYFYGGASYYDGIKWTTYNLAKGNFPSNSVSCVAIDKKGNVWFGTDKGVVKYDGSTYTIYDTLNSALPSETINCCAVDDQNNIWFGTDKGIAKFDGANWTVRNSQNSGLPYDDIWSMAIDKAGEIWFLVLNRAYGGTAGSYVVNYDGTQWNSWSAPYQVTHCMCIDSSNSVWVGTYGNGVSKFNGTSWTTFTTANSGIGYNYIEGIMADNHGNIWFGAQDYGGGVSVYNPNGVTKVNQATEVPSDFRLYQNYPNPFNPSTVITYNLPSSTHVTVTLYDVLGRIVRTLVNERQGAGTHAIRVDASDLPSGVYFYRLQADNSVEVKKMMVLK